MSDIGDLLQKMSDISNKSKLSSSEPNRRRYGQAMPGFVSRGGHLRSRGNSLVVVLVAILLVVLILGFLIPTSPPPRFAYEVKQRAQFKCIETALELFKSEFKRYPPSDALDVVGMDYCGAMKPIEAVLGRDLMGYHPESVFKSDGTDGEGKVLYPDANTLPSEAYKANLSARKGPYLPLDYANAHLLADLYGMGNTGPFASENFILCDVWKRVTHQSNGKKVGMPILYYKADTSKTAHDVNDPNNPENIYDYRDNHALLALGVPGKPGQKHPLYEDPKIFYEITKNDKIRTESRPYRADTFILLSAGYDGLYGTKDDIANFDFRWKR